MSPLAVQRPRLTLHAQDVSPGHRDALRSTLVWLTLLALTALGAFAVGRSSLYARVLDYRLAVDSTSRMCAAALSR